MSKQLEVDPNLTPTAKSALGDIPASLKELFDRDPLSLTTPEINSITEVLRLQRKNFSEAEAEAKNQGRRVNAKKAIKGVNEDFKKMMEDM